VIDTEKHKGRRFTRGDTKGIVVAGGNREGGQLNQLNWPFNISVDEEQSLDVSDFYNHRVMKWLRGAKGGIAVAGGRGQGKELTELNWPKGEIEGVVFVGENGRGDATNQFNRP
jgi:hypothetical protein